MNKEEIEEGILKECAIGIDYGQGESQSAMTNKIIIPNIENNIEKSEKLVLKTYRVYEYIINTIKENGEISEFKEDVLYIIHGLLERQLPSKELTAVQIVIENREKAIQAEKERYIRNKLEQKEYILDKVTEECYRQKNFRNRIAREPDLFNQGQEYFADKILNIIEGEKK